MENNQTDNQTGNQTDSQTDNQTDNQTGNQHKKYEQMARDEAKKSNCNKRQVGCIIVNELGNVVGRGYNGSPECNCNAPRSNKEAFCPEQVIHAEAMAIEDAFYADIDYVKYLTGPMTLYVTQPPCNKCLALIESSPADTIEIHICEQFLKFDDDKLRYDLILPEWETALAEVLTHGAKKYKPNNWQQGEIERYVAATMRHWNAYRRGKIKDSDSGFSHLWHVFTNIAFLITLEDKKQ